MLDELGWVDHAGVLNQALASYSEKVAQALRDSPIGSAESDRLLALLDSNGGRRSRQHAPPPTQ